MFNNKERITRTASDKEEQKLLESMKKSEDKEDKEDKEEEREMVDMSRGGNPHGMEIEMEREGKARGDADMTTQQTRETKTNAKGFPFFTLVHLALWAQIGKAISYLEPAFTHTLLLTILLVVINHEHPSLCFARRCAGEVLD